MDSYIKNESDYQLKSTISENDYFCVQKVEKIGTQDVFIKKIFKFDGTKGNFDNKKDISFLIAMQNPKLPFALLESFSIPTIPQEDYYVMTKFMKYRDLKTAMNNTAVPLDTLLNSWDKAVQDQPELDETSIPSLDDTQKMKICYGVAFGLNQMHRNGIVHGNLRPSNILFSEDLEPLITDFIYTKNILLNEEFQDKCDNEHLIYMAPELLNNKSKKLDYKSDVYTYSVIVDQLFKNNLAINKSFNPITLKKDKFMKFVNNQNLIYDIPDEVPKPFAEILAKNLSHNPEKRDSMETFLNYFEDPEKPALFPKYDVNGFRQYVDSLKNAI